MSETLGGWQTNAITGEAIRAARSCSRRKTGTGAALLPLSDVLGIERSSSLERALRRALQMPGVAWDVVSVDSSGRQRTLTAVLSLNRT